MKLSRKAVGLRRRSAGLLVGLLAGALALSGCSIYDAPLPGGPDAGDSPMKVKLMFRDVLDLVPQSTVKVNDLAARQQVEERAYGLEEALPLLQKLKFAKFDETVALSIRLGVDPKHADQMVRGTVVLPHGLGKTKSVLVIASPDKQREAEEAGADHVGGDDLVDKIQGGWMDFDAVVATPDMMRVVGKLGKVLGPRGLMPNPKTGTVTVDIARAVKEIKAGKVEFRVDKTGIVHAPVGKTSFPPQNLIDNATALLDSIVKAKPSAAKGKYLRSITVSSTMGPGIRIDEVRLESAGTRH